MGSFEVNIHKQWIDLLQDILYNLLLMPKESPIETGPILSRRQLIFAVGGLGGLGIVAAAVLGSRLLEPEKPPLYDGPIIDLQGRPLISDGRFEELTKALIKSGEPFLERVGREVKRLHNQTENPSGFPIIVDEETTPLVITRDYSDKALAAIFTPQEDPGPGFLIGDDTTQSEEWKYSKPGLLGINIAANELLDQRDPIEESLYLAKEHLSLMLGLRMFSEYSLFLPPGVRFLELNGSEMYDTDALARAGFAVGMRGKEGMGDRSSDFWKVGDIAPVLLLVPSIVDLIRSGKLPGGTTYTLGNYYNAATEVIRNDEYTREVYSLADDWMFSDSMLGPEDAVRRLLNPKMKELINKLYGIFYPRGASIGGPTASIGQTGIRRSQTA